MCVKLYGGRTHVGVWGKNLNTIAINRLDCVVSFSSSHIKMVEISRINSLYTNFIGFCHAIGQHLTFPFQFPRFQTC